LARIIKVGIVSSFLLGAPPWYLYFTPFISNLTEGRSIKDNSSDRNETTCNNSVSMIKKCNPVIRLP
jgi:hypothetical protein